MQLGILLAVIATIMISEHAPAHPVDVGPLRMFLTVAASLSVVLLATCGSLAISRAMQRDVAGRQTWLQWFARLQNWHMAVWLAAIAAAIYWLHWPQIVRYNWGLDRVLLLRDVLILGPVWIPLLFSWAAFYEVERAAHQPPYRSGAAAVENTTGLVLRSQFVWLRARYYLGLCLLPILALLAFQDLVTLIVPDWRDREFGWLLYLIPLLGVTVFFPQLLSRIWKTSPLPPGTLRSRLLQLSQQAGVRARDFRIWQTRGQLLNAAVTGLIPIWRYVFLTDTLLATLREDEVECVVAHELGHIRRHHLWLRILLLGLPIWIMGSAQTLAPALTDACAAWCAARLGGEFLINSLLIPTGTVIYAVTLLGRYSRLLEHDADLCVYFDGLGSVFAMTIDRLSCLSNDRRERRSWLHPSTVSRIHLLQRAFYEPAVASRFRRRVNRINCALIAIWIATPIVLACC